MIRAVLTTAILTITATLAGMAEGDARPPIPDWQSDRELCSWVWREGGGIGLWSETCRFNGAEWQVLWDENRGAFVTRTENTVIGISVQSFNLPRGAGIAELSQILVDAGHLEAKSACEWQAMELRPAPRTVSFHMLVPVDPMALAPTAAGEIPDPVCGPYGASTHGLRYFITNLRWPDRAIFVEEGQEGPLFAPSSITVLP